MGLWYTEEEKDKVRFGLKVRDVLFRGQSDFQTVEVFETEAYGRMLTLDGCVMVTDHDEFVYHEMIAHIPLCMHPNPKRVVIIGGGDGGTVREVLKHPDVEEVVLCEIDGMVVEACRKYFPKISGELDDKRVDVKIADGIAYIKQRRKDIDVLIIDSTDPIGPGEGLFSSEFYQNAAQAVAPNGIMVAQSESPWFPAEMLQRIHRNISGGFKYRHSYIGSIPTYPRGLWSWTMAANYDVQPKESLSKERFQKVASGLEYLTWERCLGAFDLPPFYSRKISL